MKRGRVSRWVIVLALFSFACSPVALVPSVLPTLGPDALNTAVAGTAMAAAAATSGGAQGLQPLATAPVGGPILDAAALNTAIAMTAGAASTQTAALIPPTLTPSVTSLPSQTPSITPTITPTWIFILPTSTNSPRPPSPGGGGSGGGGGGGTGGGGSGSGKAFYACAFISVSPANGTVFSPNEAFKTVWRVRNTGDDWLWHSADLVHTGGHRFDAVDRVDFLSTVDSGETVNLRAVQMRAPNNPGTYSTSWALQIGHQWFCSLSLNIRVKN